MASIVVHNASGTVITNGIDLPVDCSRGIATPVTISGDGEVYISVNSEPDVVGVISWEPEQDEYDSWIQDGNGNRIFFPIYGIVPAPPVSVTVTDALGHVTIIDQNTRFPEEGNFPLLHDPLVVT